uniref:Uncharacterized protein n=1 Tax=Meloidogyne enterolobii TaxID=390850 RepID=A0A6V7WTG5_MELEN|nr:unnamed protein product [Meloidogyne enterolobii]
MSSVMSNSYRDLNNSNYTCDELPPSSIIKWPGVHLISIDSIKDAKIGVGIENSVDGVRTVGIILQINEEGVITGINECCSSGKENLRFKLKNVDLVVKRSERYDGKFNNDEVICICYTGGSLPKISSVILRWGLL